MLLQLLCTLDVTHGNFRKNSSILTNIEYFSTNQRPASGWQPPSLGLKIHTLCPKFGVEINQELFCRLQIAKSKTISAFSNRFSSKSKARIQICIFWSSYRSFRSFECSFRSSKRTSPRDFNGIHWMDSFDSKLSSEAHNCREAV